MIGSSRAETSTAVNAARAPQRKKCNVVAEHGPRAEMMLNEHYVNELRIHRSGGARKALVDEMDNGNPTVSDHS